MKHLLDPFKGTKCYMQGRILTEKELVLLQQKGIIIHHTSRNACTYLYINNESELTFCDSMRDFYDSQFTVVDSAEIIPVLDRAITTPTFKKFEPVLAKINNFEKGEGMTRRISARNSKFFIASYQEYSENTHIIMPNISVDECLPLKGNEHLVEFDLKLLSNTYWVKLNHDEGQLLPKNTPVMVSDCGESWQIRFYCKKNLCFSGDKKSLCAWCYIVPMSDFDFLTELPAKLVPALTSKELMCNTSKSIV